MNQESQNATVSLNILLPRSIKDFIDQQVANEGFSTPSEYLCELVMDAKDRLVEEQIEQMLIEALDSGEPIEVTPDYWQNKRAELLAKYGNESKAA